MFYQSVKGMIHLYYSTPYYSNTHIPFYYPNNISRNLPGYDHPLSETILRGIKREASAMELYRQLLYIAPNPKHQADILNALEGKKACLSQFTNLYMNLTGAQPMYNFDKVPFQSYQEGVQKAYAIEMEGFEEYQRNGSLTQYPQIQHVFLGALSVEQENKVRLASLNEEFSNRKTDFGPEPFVIDINEATKKNNTFRTAIWTGKHLQVTLMSINVGDDIGLEIHPHLDQFLRIEEGQGLVQMGNSNDKLDFEKKVFDDFAIVIPAGTWHNVTNTGNQPLKLYSIYAPPQHPFGTVHVTKADAMAAEEEHHHNNRKLSVYDMLLD